MINHNIFSLPFLTSMQKKRKKKKTISFLTCCMVVISQDIDVTLTEIQRANVACQIIGYTNVGRETVAIGVKNHWLVITHINLLYQIDELEEFNIVQQIDQNGGQNY